jgi:hypothetical protein
MVKITREACFLLVGASPTSLLVRERTMSRGTPARVTFLNPHKCMERNENDLLARPIVRFAFAQG